MAEHVLKTWPNAFEAVRDGRKRFEWRSDDRGFEVGDTLVLALYDPQDEFNWDFKPERARVPKLRVRVTYILRGLFGVPPGFCVMSIELDKEPSNG
ncbi:MAG TPA: DUF3850 domain-containing protein [Polyangiaceae bacterium]|nr:DUF3850 domain-containing protein [Polyangiaceae bacterium]